MFKIRDNFLPQELFDSFREHCDQVEYTDFTSPVDGVVYPGISFDIPAAVRRYFAGSKFLFLRLSLAGMRAPHQAHTDSSMGTSSAMFYLNRQEDARGGTALVEHKATGMRDDPVDEAELAVWQRDVNDPAAWEVYYQAEMKPNRLFVFPAQLMHRAEPIGGFGDGPKTGRLVLTAFY